MDYELLLMLLCPSKREARSSSTHQRCPEPLKVCETVLHRAVAFTLENPFLLLSYNDHTSRHKHCVYQANLPGTISEVPSPMLM